ncbi:Hsp20/alpha crystallin family protein [Breoghania sp. L-A4]|uniref:Hsp20/alpha crystallin family protein n=1 Tax=Breoghania sp. L-A4 TaxID=2304600 RepID=UPI000E35901B|nr:Hsp20/alpha crystallin family protein [Breoghania sp. L-A4]AXS39370.1 Hsp20/alpha crystallin family protein [Breoghania sp. L-A4]
MRSVIPTLWGGEDKPFSSLHKEIDRLFDDFTKRGLPGAEMFGGKMPAIEVTETDGGVDVTAELPGVAESDIDVSINDHYLTIKGEKKQEKETKDKDVHVSERSYGAFRRTISLPFEPDSDKVQADFDKGVLSVHIPKPAEVAQKEKKIKIGKS